MKNYLIKPLYRYFITDTIRAMKLSFKAIPTWKYENNFFGKIDSEYSSYNKEKQMDRNCFWHSYYRNKQLNKKQATNFTYLKCIKYFSKYLIKAYNSFIKKNSYMDNMR